MAQNTISMTPEQLQHLISEAVRLATTGNNEAVAAAAKTKGSFSSCDSRFGGQRDHEVVDEFITNICTYKDVEAISDENALKGISLLFYGHASTWWQGIRKEAKTWKDALELIRTHFAPIRPAYQIYLDIFNEKQDEQTAIDTFVCQKRALLAQLPEGRHDEETELDLVYGLLHINYRQYIPRHEVTNFRELLEKGRIIEQNNLEAKQSQKDPVKGTKNTKRCTYCNYRGHTFDKCRKRAQASDKSAAE